MFTVTTVYEWTMASHIYSFIICIIFWVRSILQRWKRALHVPLRLDVYYQHADSRRELLERWCLEYAPKTSNSYPTGNNGPLINQSADPIVQLRQVCKQIVIWLRCLYCWSRMLPAQALRSQNTQNNAIGFSIYVVSEGNDDVSSLVSQQGFSSQSQPHSVVTPYGELGWKVFYAPKNAVQRLIPEVPPYSQAMNIPTNRTSSQPIPMRSQQYQQHQQHQQQQQSQAQSFHPSRELTRRDSTPLTTIARSAPQNTGRTYQRSKSDISGGADHAGTLDDLELNQQQPVSPHHLQQNKVQGIGWTANDSTDPPTKNLSALSLAMMTLSDHDDASTTNGNESTTKFAANAEAAEKRRAALHHAPPHLPSSPGLNRKSPLGTAGEYGYAYIEVKQYSAQCKSSPFPVVDACAHTIGVHSSWLSLGRSNSSSCFQLVESYSSPGRCNTTLYSTPRFCWRTSHAATSSSRLDGECFWYSKSKALSCHGSRAPARHGHPSTNYILGSIALKPVPPTHLWKHFCCRVEYGGGYRAFSFHE